MKKIIILSALLLSSYSNAVHLSNDGTGQVLIFPYYTVNGGFNTLINLTNTTDKAKALRVTFREAANSRSVFAFNLYLGAYDVWTGALVIGDEEYTKLITNDQSCTYPMINDEYSLFNKSRFQGILADGYGEETNRLREGFVEVIEMGVLTGDSAVATTILDGLPISGCDSFTDAWSDNGYWLSDSSTDMLPPSGGIAGNILLIDVQQGIAVSENATALANFSDEIIHHSILDESPTLADGNKQSVIVDSEGNSLSIDWGTGIQAVSAVLTSTSINNEFVITDSIGASTEWIMTMPTRQFHLDPLFAVSQTPVAPFTHEIESNVNCQTFNADKTFNRESLSLYQSTGGGIVVGSPLPPEAISDTLCYATNSTSFKHTEEGSDFISFLESNFPIKRYYTNGENLDFTYALPFETGFAEFEFLTQVTKPTYEDREIDIYGLPVIGFAVQNYVNASFSSGVKANYAGIFDHKKSVKVNLHSSQATNSQGSGDSKLMQISGNNIGQVLLYPYYTVTNDMNSLISVVNPTGEVKALSVRFLEGKNNRECLTFNVYLSAYDVWTAALVETTSSVVGHVGESSVKLITNDNSCVVPNFISTQGQEFLPYYFSDSFDDGLGVNLQRCTEGHIEIFDMGQLLGSDAIAAMHNADGIANNCELLEDNWKAPSGKWYVDPDSADNVIPSEAGIYGSLSLINVYDGIDMSYDATAISYFSSEIMHSGPGSDYAIPNLSSGNNLNTLIQTKDAVLESSWNTSIDAVSALFMQTEISNDFVTTDSIGADSVWVNLYPTKQFYIDPIHDSLGLVTNAPFNGSLQANGACNDIDLKAYDREQNVSFYEDNLVLPGVSPPGFEEVKPINCWSLNVEKVSTTDTDNSGLIFASNLSNVILPGLFEYYPLSDLPFSEGYVSINFDAQHSKIEGINIKTNEPINLYGKPVLGFMAQKYVNGNLGNTDSVLANYAILSKNKGAKRIEVVTE